MTATSPPSSVNPWLAHPTTIRSITDEMGDTNTYELTFDDDEIAASYQFAPGQFNMMYLPGYGESAISISSDPQRSMSLSHTVRVAGNVTRAMARLKQGDQILIRGPYGTAWPMQGCEEQDVVIATGGIGLAPLRPAIYHILNNREKYGRVSIVYGARSPNDLLYPTEYDQWRNGGLDVEITVDVANDNWKGRVGVVPKLIDGLTLDCDNTTVLTCGPEIMMRFVILESRGRGIPPERLYLSMERNMNCAIGLCGHCQLGPAFICKDGPVFSLNQMEPYLNLEDL